MWFAAFLPTPYLWKEIEIEMSTQWEVSCVPYLCFQLVMQDACSILVSLSHCVHCTPATQACHLQLIWYSSIHFHGVSLSFFFMTYEFCIFLFLFFAWEMAAEDTGVFELWLLTKLKFLSRHVPNESLSITFWMNTLTTVLLFKAAHQP